MYNHFYSVFWGNVSYIIKIKRPTKIQILDFRGFCGGGEPYIISVTTDISVYRHNN